MGRIASALRTKGRHENMKIKHYVEDNRGKVVGGYIFGGTKAEYNKVMEEYRDLMDEIVLSCCERQETKPKYRIFSIEDCLIEQFRNTLRRNSLKF